MRPAALNLLAAVIPVAGTLTAFVLTAQAGKIPMCNPFIDGCASISATGREPPGALLFRAVQLPYAVLLAIIWALTVSWLKSIGAVSATGARWILGCGLAGAAALVIYVTFLGTATPVYSFMRRFGIYFYFLGTALAQLITTFRIRAAAADWRLAGTARFMLVVVLLPFVLGIANLVQKAIVADPDPAENAIEWIASLSMQAWFFGLYVAWRRTGFAVRAETTVSHSP